MKQPSSIIILGIDPGTIRTGFGLIEKKRSNYQFVSAGVITTTSNEALSLRLRKIYNQLLLIINKYSPDECAIETAFYGKNVQSLLKLGHARGVSILAAVNRELAITEYSPREIKRAVTGSGASSKQQVQFMIRKILNLETDFASHDESDALAIALCHGQHISAPRKKFSSWSEFVVQHPERIKVRK